MYAKVKNTIRNNFFLLKIFLIIKIYGNPYSIIYYKGGDIFDLIFIRNKFINYLIKFFFLIELFIKNKYYYSIIKKINKF